MDPRGVWFGEGPLSASIRLVLWPLSAAYGVTMRARRALYSGGVLRVHPAALPTISVGNLTAGGTGKTPMAAWLAGKLQTRVPTAIVLRGYGTDELNVHYRLNPTLSVIVKNPDRVAALLEARGAGAKVAVLDDGFQHRRVARTADVVLLSVEQLRRPRRLLPAGPWREPLATAATADVIVLTRKSASAAEARAERDALANVFPRVPIAIVSLAPSGLVAAVGNETRPLESLRGSAVLAIAAIGEPESFRSQLEQLGARAQLAAFRDHHEFTPEDVNRLAATAPDALAVCTLKDAVKLAALWPTSRALWYVSQRLEIEAGAEHLDQLCARVLDQVNPAG